MAHIESLESQLKNQAPILLNCEECGYPRRLVVENCVGTVGRKPINLSNVPLLKCDNCKIYTLDGYSRSLVNGAVEISAAEPEVAMTLDLHAACIDVDYSLYPNFSVDPVDYYFLPGLWRPHESGFLTPVYFRRRVLHRYHSDDSYDLDYTSNSYGTIEFQNGKMIPFGINRQELVLMWLGDIASLPADEQSYLQSENVSSDHDIASDFYRGQIDCEFEYDSREHELLLFHTEFKKKLKNELGVRLTKYDDDIQEALKDLREPPLWNEKELAHVWTSMNNLFVESLNNGSLKKVIKQSSPDTDLKDKRGLKLLDILLSMTLQGYSDSILSPLFVLYDLRVLVSHRRSDSSLEKREYCYSRLGLDSGTAGLKDLHLSLLLALKEMYVQLIEGEYIRGQKQL